VQNQNSSYLPVLVTRVKAKSWWTQWNMPQLFLLTMGTYVVGMASILALSASISALMGQLQDFLTEMLFNANSLFHFMLVVVIYTIMWPFTGMVAMKKEKQAEQKRQMAAAGAWHLLADQQPRLGRSSLPLPVVIHYRANWKLRIPLLLIIAILPSFILLITLMVPFSYKTVTFGCIYTLIYIAAIWSVMRNASRIVVADERGFSVYRGEKRLQHIPWTEARLFAIVDSTRNFSGAWPRTFELASERAIIHWQAQSGHIWNEWQRLKVMLTPEQYAFQLQELHMIIVEKTSLPLYDLRK
jgi:predicted membrane protein